MGNGLIEDEHRSFAKRHPRATVYIVVALATTLFLFACLLLADCVFLLGFAPPEFWVKVPGVEGLDRRSTDADATAPTFHITLRVNFERGKPSWPVCGKGGSVVVSYAGVPIAHGDLPEFCAWVGVVASVPVVATSEGLGLPDELYERMQSQRRRHERVPLAVHVRIDKLTGSRGSPSPVQLWCTAILHGQPEGPFVCPVLK